MNSARQKSTDMASKGYFSHTSPTYGSPFDQMKANGVTYKSAAENIAMGQRTAEEVVRGWMESPGHRQNILTLDFTHIGIGYEKKPETTGRSNLSRNNMIEESSFAPESFRYRG